MGVDWPAPKEGWVCDQSTTNVNLGIRDTMPGGKLLENGIRRSLLISA